MIHLGQVNNLKIVRIVEPGAILGDQDGHEVLLPGKYIPPGAEVEDELDVFVYNDSEDRPVATTETPHVKVNEFAILGVKEINRTGAFFNWGLEKDLLVPFSEQNRRLENGKSYLIYLYLDHVTDRLVGTTRVSRYFEKDISALIAGQKVTLLVGEETDIGINVVVDGRYRGMIFKNEIFRKIDIGDRITGYISKIREDSKLDIALKPPGLASLSEGADNILMELQKAGGYLPVHDKSSPEQIQERFQMSKKNFKRSVGILFKQKKIMIEKDGIRSL